MALPRDSFGPEYIVRLTDPKLDLEGFLVIDNTALGPGKGGIRMTPTVTLEETFRLARTMTWKNALSGIPFGGAKAGLVIKSQTGEEKKKLVQSFARALKPLIPKKYIAGPDVKSGEEEMQWFAEAVGKWNASTGKPSHFCTDKGGRKICGLPHELGSTGFGVAHAAKVAAEVLGLPLRGAKVAIEGFGNVGVFAMKHLTEFGARVVAVSDSRGAIFSEGGIEYENLVNVKKGGSVTNYSRAQVIPRDELLSLQVDILITAALTDVINEKNKDSIRAKLIVEGSNIPMREEVEHELWRKGTAIVPDFVANAGGVISSYAEYRGMSPEEMFKLVERKIVKATRQVLRESKKHKRHPREVAVEIAKKKVEEKNKKRTVTFS